MAADLSRIQAELAVRVDEFRMGGDPARILDDETLRLLFAMAIAIEEEAGASTSTMADYGWAWWCRHLARETAGTTSTTDDNDLDEARLIFYVVELLDVTLVPEELRHAMPADPGCDPGALLDRARRLIGTGAWTEAAGLAYAAIHATPQGRIERTAVLTEAGSLLYGAFLCSADPKYLDRASAVFTMAIDDCPPGDPLLADLWSGAAVVAEHQYRLSDDPRDLKHAIGHWRMAAAQYLEGSEKRAAADAELSAMLLADYQVVHDGDLVLEAVAHARRALHPAVSGLERTRRHWRLGNALIVAHTVTHAMADVDEAITAFREVAGDLAFPLPGDIRHCLFLLYRVRFGWYGRSRDLDTALWWGEYSVQCDSPDFHWHDEDAVALNLLHNLDQAHGPNAPAHCRDVRDDWLTTPLRERILGFVRHNDPAQLLAADAVPLAVTAIKHYRRDTSSTKTQQLYTIAWFFWCRYIAQPAEDGADDFRLAGDYFARLAQIDPQLIAEPIAQLIEMGEVDLDPNHYRTLSHMAAELQRTEANTDAAISLLRRLLPLVESENQDRCRAILTWALAVRAHQQWSTEDLDEAAAMLGDLASDAPTAAPERALYLSRLAARLESRFQRGRAIADFDTTIAAYENALSDTLAPAKRANLLPGVSAAYWSRYENFGRLPDLEAAVRWGREAVVHPDVASPMVQVDALNNLSIALGKRFLRVGEQSDIDEAITVSRTAVRQMDSLMTPRQMNYLGARHNLRALLFMRYQAFRALKDLDEAITIGRGLVGLAMTGSERLSEFLTALSVTLLHRHGLTDGEGFLDEAIAAGRQALAATPADHPFRPWALFNLAIVLREHSTEQHDLDEAISLFREATATVPPDHPERANTMVNLAEALFRRFARDRSLIDLDLGIKASRAALGITAANPDKRFHAAEIWAASAVTAKMWRTAAEGYDAAVSLLPLVSWRGGSRTTRERLLADRRPVAHDGSAAALEAKRPNQAVQILEAGRNVLWSQLLETRSDLAALQEFAPELAARCEAIRAELDYDHRMDGMDGLAFNGS